MDCLELKAVMDAVGIASYGKCTVKYDRVVDAYEFENMRISGSDSYYTIVHGEIPLEVADTIYKKYPKNQYSIRVCGNGDYENPRDWAHNGFIGGYHIDTKEGVLIFIEEMRDYKLRRLGLPETEVQKYDEQIALVNSNILSSFNGIYSAHDWMQETRHKEAYNKLVEQDKKSQVWSSFRNLLEEFDMAVNPFLDKNFELDDPNNYSKKVEIDAFSGFNGFGEPVHSFTITQLSGDDSEEKSFTNYCLDSNGFSFKLEYAFPDKRRLIVVHTHYGANNEFVSITYGADFGEPYYQLNLYDKTVKMPYEVTSGVDEGSIRTFTDELGKAIQYAKKITIESMRKKQPVIEKQ